MVYTRGVHLNCLHQFINFVPKMSCSAVWCKNRKDLRIFPTDIEISKEWIKFCDRGEDWVPTKNSRLCLKHFKPSDYKKNCIFIHKNKNKIRFEDLQ